MKLSYKITSIFLSCVMLASCTSTQKITVTGKPGTEIYLPVSASEGQKVATIGINGNVKIKLNGDAYYAYLLSKSPGSDLYVPFALDYKNHGYTGAQTANVCSYILGFIGAVATVVGAVGACSSDDSDSDNSVFSTIVVAGGGATLLGGFTGMATSMRMESIDHKYRFKYLSTQSTNEDITFTRPVITPVAAAAPATDETEASSGSSATDEAEVSVSTARVSDRSTRTFKDYGSMVEGRYVGTGVLSLGDETIEQYDNMVIEIVRVDKNTVEVSVIDADGEAFFSTPSQYTIKKPANNTYTLTHSDIAKATIKINKNKKAVYLHPRVNIDGDIYTLKITATLQ